MREQTSATLRVLTFEPEQPDNLITLDNTRSCTGAYTCDCASCQLERERRIRAGVRTNRQPWHTKAA